MPAAIIVPDGMFGGAFCVVGATGGGGPTQVRATFAAHATGAGCKVDHVSIGIKAAAGDPYDTASTPVEFLFTGVAGFNLAAGASIVSDWATLTISATTGTVYSRTLGFNDAGWGGYSVRNVVGPITGGANLLVLIYDMTSGGPADLFLAAGVSDQLYYKSASASYNVADATGFTTYGANAYVCSKLETQ